MSMRVARILLAGATAAAAVVLGAGSASADPIIPSSWTVNPGGSVDGSAGQTVLTIQESGVQLTCQTSTATDAVVATGGTGSPARLVTLPAGSVAFQDCSGPFGLTFEVEHVGDWFLDAETYDPDTGVAAGDLTNIVANLSGLGCDATVAGKVEGTYTNGTATLATVVPTGVSELVVTRVDPENNCFGLVNEGEHGVFDGSYSISPAQTIVGNP